MSVSINFIISCFALEFKPLDLPCGSNFTISVRDELLDMEAVSKMFEEDEDIVNEAQQQITNGSDMTLLSKLYQLAQDDGYFPYCKIDFDPNCNLRQSVPDHVSLSKILVLKWI